MPENPLRPGDAAFDGVVPLVDLFRTDFHPGVRTELRHDLDGRILPVHAQRGGDVADLPVTHAPEVGQDIERELVVIQPDRNQLLADVRHHRDAAAELLRLFGSDLRQHVDDAVDQAARKTAQHLLALLVIQPGQADHRAV